MKTRSLTNLSQALALALSALPFVGGCTATSATDVESVNTNFPPAAVTSTGDSSTESTPTEPAAPVPRAEPVLPPNILPASPLAEVVKLAQAGLDENVMLAFVTNSLKPFHLDSEQIVYLNDIGVPSSVITSMMQHDQGLQSSESNLAQAAPPNPVPTLTPEPEPVATAPSYVNEPPATSEAAPTPIVSNNYFYESLAPYGNWVEIEGYGRCWQPTVVVGNPNWQPYGDRGRWVYTDAGWYWLSDYSWGATTFHYGRWFSSPTWGWCWWPDTVWAPSWVNWRYSGAYCGWAPLPPPACYRAGFGFTYYGSSVGISFGFGLGVSAYTFVPWGNFCGARPYQYRVPPHYANQVYNNTTIINNYGNGNNNTVINRGISPDRVRHYARTEVKTVHLREAAGGARNERLERDGRTLAVHRPNLTPLQGSREVRMDIPVRPDSRRLSQPTVAGVPQNAANNPVARSGRLGGVVERPLAGGNAAPAQVAPSARVEARPSRSVQQPANINSVNVSRVGSPASTARVNQPRVYQVSPQNTARPTAATPAGSLIVIGGKSTTRSPSTTRDYSVWSTPSPAPTASVPLSSPRVSAPSANVGSSPAPANISAPASRTQVDRDFASRDSYPTFSTPSTRAPSYTPRPLPVISAPRSAPQPAYQPSRSPGPTVESRSAPAPAAPTVAPTRPQPGSGDTSPGPRSR